MAVTRSARPSLLNSVFQLSPRVTIKRRSSKPACYSTGQTQSANSFFPILPKLNHRCLISPPWVAVLAPHYKLQLLEHRLPIRATLNYGVSRLCQKGLHHVTLLFPRQTKPSLGLVACTEAPSPYLRLSLPSLTSVPGHCHYPEAPVAGISIKYRRHG